jgi:hypothetical protein
MRFVPVQSDHVVFVDRLPPGHFWVALEAWPYSSWCNRCGSLATVRNGGRAYRVVNQIERGIANHDGWLDVTPLCYTGIVSVKP